MTAAKIGRSMKKRENMSGRASLLAGRDFHAAGIRSLPLPSPPAVPAGGHGRRAALGEQRLAHGYCAELREFDVGALVAGPVGEAGDIDRVRACLHGGNEFLEQPHRLGIERGLAGGEVDDTVAPAARVAGAASSESGFGTYGVTLTVASGASRKVPSTTT